MLKSSVDQGRNFLHCRFRCLNKLTSFLVHCLVFGRVLLYPVPTVMNLLVIVDSNAVLMAQAAYELSLD